MRLNFRNNSISEFIVSIFPDSFEIGILLTRLMGFEGILRDSWRIFEIFQDSLVKFKDFCGFVSGFFWNWDSVIFFKDFLGFFEVLEGFFLVWMAAGFHQDLTFRFFRILMGFFLDFFVTIPWKMNQILKVGDVLTKGDYQHMINHRYRICLSIEIYLKVLCSSHYTTIGLNLEFDYLL